MLKILVVDDRADTRDFLNDYLLTCILTDGDGIVSLAENGIEAKAILEKESFDLIITDMDMPKMGGVELIEWIKTNQPRLPVILMTGGEEPPNHKADVFLKKMSLPEKLEEVIKTLFQLKAG